MTIFPATVLHTARVTPRMVRVSLGCPGELGPSGRPDEYCAVHPPPVPGEGPVVPAGGAHDDRARHYTVRRWHPAGFDVDVVVHDGGIGSAWAATAAPGDVVTVDRPGGGTYRPPAGSTRLLLLGDATALPAIGRIVEGLDAGVRAHVVAVVADAGEQQHWTGAGEVRVEWVHEPDPERLGPVLLAAARAASPPADGFTWVAGENVAARLIRRHLRHDLGLPGTAYGTMGYWRPRGEEWAARYAAVAAEVEARLDAAGRAHPDEEEFTDAAEAIYEKAGL